MPSTRSYAAVALTALTVLTAPVVLAGCEHDDLKSPIAVQSVAVLPALTAAQTRGLVSMPWIRQQFVPVGDTVVVEVAATACPRLRGAVVTETPAAVTVQVFGTLTRCTEQPGGFVVAPIRLPGPLGSRTLRHGPVMPAGAVVGNGPPARLTPPGRGVAGERDPGRS